MAICYRYSRCRPRPLLDIEHTFDVTLLGWLSPVKSHWTTSECRCTR
jgi:hypothetical protein